MDEHRDYFYATNYVYDYKRVELDEKEKRSLLEQQALRYIVQLAAAVVADVRIYYLAGSI